MARTNETPGEEHQLLIEAGGVERAILARAGEPLLSILQGAGFAVESTCGGRGACGTCRVRYVSEAPAAKASDRASLSEEELRAGWRLACEHPVDGSARIVLRAVDG